MRKHLRSRIPNAVSFIAAVFLISVSHRAAIAQSSPNGDIQAQNPSLIDALGFEAGGLSSFKKGTPDTFYYHLTYKGKLLTKKGTPPSLANVTQPFNLSTDKADQQNTGGDTNNLILRLERGTSEISGGLFDGLGIQPFHLNSNISLLRDLRGTIQISSRLDGKQFNIAGGLETPPLHPLHFINRGLKAGITNWLTFGISEEDQQKSGAKAKNQGVLLGTYRLFIGRGFGWKSNTTFAAQFANKVLKVVPTPEDEDKYIKKLEATGPPTGVRSHVDTVIETLGEASVTERANWTQTVLSGATKYAASFSTHPTAALWLEASGFYFINGDTLGGDRFNNLFAATFKYWINPQDNNPIWLQLRYENGRERAAPDIEIKSLTFAIGTTF